MWLQWLKLSNFRNYSQLFLENFSKLNVFFGKNAQGKTNLLEAIYLLATLQTFRSAENKDLIFWDQKQALLEGKLIHRDIHRVFSLLIDEKHKRPKIDDKTIQKAKEYFGAMNVISFAPGDLQTLQGGPQNRRRYLDRTLFHLDPLYAQEIGNYMRALIQRNAALKFEDDIQSEIWGEKLIQSGAQILRKRLQFIEKLNTLTPCLYQQISGLDEKIEVRYETSLSEILNSKNEAELLEILRQTQQKMLWREKKIKRSLVGPHRDEFSVWIGGKNLRKFGSQGEQRTAILALKFTELEIFEKEIHPIFLLDDVSSELDEIRKNYLFNALLEKNVQTFITTTDLKNVKLSKKDAKMYFVHQGTLTEQ